MYEDRIRAAEEEWRTIDRSWLPATTSEQRIAHALSLPDECWIEADYAAGHYTDDRGRIHGCPWRAALSPWDGGPVLWPSDLRDRRIAARREAIDRTMDARRRIFWLVMSDKSKVA